MFPYVNENQQASDVEAVGAVDRGFTKHKIDLPKRQKRGFKNGSAHDIGCFKLVFMTVFKSGGNYH